MRRAVPFLCAGILAVGVLFLKSCQAPDYTIIGTLEDDTVGTYATIAEREGVRFLLIADREYPWRDGQLFLVRSKLPATSSPRLAAVDLADYPVVCLMVDPDLEIVSVWRIADGLQLFP